VRVSELLIDRVLSPCSKASAPSFYRPRGVAHKHAAWVLLPVYSSCDLKAVLANPGPCACRVGYCACLEAASRVVLPALVSDRRPYVNSRV
jgi:hypothetical protein